MSLQPPLDVDDVCAVSRRGVNRVKNASNSGALQCLPRVPGGPHFFTEEAVADWIRRGSPEMPMSRRMGGVG
ncbi:hypothetical protein [Rhodococcus jostii]|uniref:hypothetical protein n=1 Tax=Rhodococcus jostii TaxID=132919 RepID=UPI00363AB753